jgi:hypothetical protein
MAKTRKRKQKQTLREFKAWLQGVEELQAENWCPNREQWVLIREKIDNIIEEKKTVEKTTQPAPQQPMQPMQPMQHPQQPVQQPIQEQGSTLPFPPPPPVSGGVPPADIEMTPAAKKMLDPKANGGKTKTPDIDTSDGNVASPFA